jgi:hypothetical protein
VRERPAEAPRLASAPRGASADYEVVDDGTAPDPVVSVQPAANVPKNPPRPAALASTPDDEPVEDYPAELLDDEPDEGEHQPDSRPRKKKKKKKGSAAARRSTDENWRGPVIALGVLIAVLVVAGVVGLFCGPVGIVLVILATLTLVISVPISIIILIGSMFLSSVLMGGIDFGDARVVIPKALILLIVVNLIYLIPIVGWFIAAPVWLLGVMYMFRLDMWEARLLTGVNWILNTIVHWLAIMTMVASIAGTVEKAENIEPAPNQFRPPPQRPWRGNPRRWEVDLPTIKELSPVSGVAGS